MFVLNEPKPSIQIQQLAQWFQTTKGQRLLADEMSLIQRVLPKFFGSYTCISTLCALKPLNAMGSNHRQLLLLPNGLNQQACQLIKGDHGLVLQCAFSQLPLQTDSLDGLVLLHTLDFVEKPHEAVREIARVIRPGGQLFILGFNPASFLGLSRIMPERLKSAYWSARCLRRGRLLDWLALLDFELESHGGLSLNTWFNNEQSRRYALGEKPSGDQQHSFFQSVFQHIAHLCQAHFSSIYVVRVRKIHRPLTPVGLNWLYKTASWNPLRPRVTATPQTRVDSKSNQDKPPQKRPD